jgi:hypothetical protein
MGKYTKENGIEIKCKDLEKQYGLMGEFTKDNFLKIKEKDTECMNGKMVENMLEIGKMENKMESVFILIKKKYLLILYRYLY